MTDPVGLRQYPNSTPEGSIIPFDVGVPYGLYIVSVTGAALVAARKLPVDASLCTAMATVRSILSFEGTAPAVTEDTFQSNFILLPANKLVHFVLPSNIFNCISAAAEVGKIYLQLWTPFQATGVASLKQHM